MPARTETADFWVGRFPDEDAFSDYFGESAEYYEFLENSPASVKAPRKGYPRTPGTPPLTAFIGDQGHDWYDSSQGEMGFNAKAKSIAKLVTGYSYSDQWGSELAAKVAQHKLQGVNSFFFLTAGIVAKPRSVKGEDYWVEYVGQITYRI